MVTAVTMASAQPFPQRQSSLTAIGISLAVHAVLIGAWQLARPVRLHDELDPGPVQFLRLLPVPASAPAPLPERREIRPPSPAPRPRTLATAARPPPIVPVPAVSTPETMTLPAPQTAGMPGATLSAADLLRDAKAAAGAVDRALRSENPRRGIYAPVETAQMKLDKGISHAAEMAPNRWYQAPKVQEIQDPGGYGRKRYRVVGANGTYCVTYESNHAPDGIDTMQRGIQPKLTRCPQHEGPATSQKWE
jgi:hypothetical protein